MDIKQIRTITSPVQVATPEQRTAIRPMVEGALLKLGAEQVDIDAIRFPNAIYNSALMLGHVPGVITLAGSIVVKGVMHLLPQYHPSVKEDYLRSGEQIQHLPRFIWLTWGEDWWSGLPYNVVETDVDYLEYLRYIFSVKDEQVRSFVKRGRGRPPSAHKKAVKAVSGYAQWIQDCAAYRAQVKQGAEALEALEVHTRERIAELKVELAERIQAQKDILSDARAALVELRKRGAPKLTN